MTPFEPHDWLLVTGAVVLWASLLIYCGSRWLYYPRKRALAIQQEIDSMNESRSPDGDGLPMVKGLGDGRGLPRASVKPTDLTAGIGQRTSALESVGGSAVHLKPAAGSEPADSHFSLPPLDYSRMRQRDPRVRLATLPEAKECEMRRLARVEAEARAAQQRI